ncbi:MAG TPA: fatty acid desaturase [Acidimicrobiia bacterium]|nr:fatty acid desaturase [Acidimicrobiia bacterium]
MAAWRNPTFWVLGLDGALVGLGTYGYLAGGWPAWVTVVLHAAAIYLGFTVLHESVHRLAHRKRAVNDAVGWVAGLPLTVTQPTFRVVHLAHHAKTNQPGDDPDFVVGRGAWWWRPVSFVSPLWEYRLYYYGRRAWKNRVELAAQAGLDAVVLAIIAGAALTGTLGAVAVLWIFPALLAVGCLGFAFDYLPHRPQDSTERYLDTRVYPSPVLNVVLLGQNYHLVHHAWVTVPWFFYQPVFQAVEGELEAVGARTRRGAWRRPLTVPAAG